MKKKGKEHLQTHSVKPVLHLSQKERITGQSLEYRRQNPQQNIGKSNSIVYKKDHTP
jgi:hypothetical protein